MKKKQLNKYIDKMQKREINRIIILGLIILVVALYSMFGNTLLMNLAARQYIGSNQCRWLDEIRKSNYGLIRIQIATNSDIDGNLYERNVIKDNSGQIIFEGDWIEYKEPKNENELTKIDIEQYFIIRKLYNK